MKSPSTIAVILTLLSLLTCSLVAAQGDPDESFAANVAPFLRMHCDRCHGGEQPEAGLSLERYRESANIQRDYVVWQKILKMIVERQMPPEGEPQLTESQRVAAIEAVEAELAKFDCLSERHPGRVTLRRLNRTEYNNTIRDLVGVDFKPASDFPADDVGNGFDNMGDVLSISPVLLEKYLAAAEQVIDRAFADDASRNRILAVGREDGLGRTEAARRSLELFASRAFRRPATGNEIERLTGLVKYARDNGSSDEDAFKTALQAILCSPHFLFRVEMDPAADDPDGIRQLSDYELASRLSYFLWSSMPDRELFDLCRRRSLGEPGVLDAQVKRMLRDPKAAALVNNFAGQWLQLRDLATMTPDPERYPDFDDQLRSAMLRETEMFFEAMIRDDRSVLQFLDADYTFANQRLARHYGLAGVEGEEFRRVKLNDQRRGVLTQASILLLTSNPTRTSPVKRGKWILENILGEPPPPPPAAVPELDAEVELLGSLRERMEQHRANESCAVCHRKMDALGFGLENFDGIGGWRERDGQFPIDASGVLPGGFEFQGPRQLMELLKEQKSDAFCRCLTEKMLSYAIGRGLESYDRCAVDKILKRLAENDFRFSALVMGVVASDPFQMRESKQPERGE